MAVMLASAASARVARRTVCAAAAAARRRRMHTWVVTNRTVLREGGGRAEELFGDVPSARGPSELRVAKAVHGASGHHLELLPDRDANGERASRFMAVDLLEQCSRNIVFFCHGYNNTLTDALGTCKRMRQLYDVEPVLFSWPSNGGGETLLDDITGVAQYLDDKQDARASAGALSRALARAARYVHALRRDDCARTVNAVFHSMGNYVLKYSLLPRRSGSAVRLFDNIVLTAADTNNVGHEQWMARLRFNSRLYVCLNEGDNALRASRFKTGDEQWARLGHWPNNLVAPEATYVNLSNVLGGQHSYHVDSGGSTQVEQLYRDMLNGRVVEHRLRFNPHHRYYHF